MGNWRKLSDMEYREIADRFYREFHFSRSDRPAIREPTPFITYDLSRYMKIGWTEDEYDDLHRKALRVFRSCTAAGEWLLALDLQHDCYMFNPRLPIDRDPEFDEWLVPVFPDGDYYVFLTMDFRNGVFGHPWEGSMCVFGQCFITAFQRQTPMMFRRILRASARSQESVL